MRPQRLQHHIPPTSLAGGLGPLAPRTMSCMFTLLPSITLISNSPAAKIITQPGRFAVSVKGGDMRRCKQTGSCLHRASAALSIFNSVRNSSRAGGGGRNVWFRTRHVGSTLKFADGLICLQIVPQNEEPVAHISRKKIPSGTRRGTFGFTRTGGSIWQR